jgi:hypothetical protein
LERVVARQCDRFLLGALAVTLLPSFAPKFLGHPLDLRTATGNRFLRLRRCRWSDRLGLSRVHDQRRVGSVAAGWRARLGNSLGLGGLRGRRLRFVGAVSGHEPERVYQITDYRYFQILLKDADTFRGPLLRYIEPPQQRHPFAMPTPFPQPGQNLAEVNGFVKIHAAMALHFRVQSLGGYLVGVISRPHDSRDW